MQQHTKNDNSSKPYYKELSILDSKASALLRISGALLSVAVLGIAFDQTFTDYRPIGKIIAWCFLISSVLAMQILYVDWAATDCTVKVREWCLRGALGFNYIGLGLVASILVILPN